VLGPVALTLPFRLGAFTPAAALNGLFGAVVVITGLLGAPPPTVDGEPAESFDRSIGGTGGALFLVVTGLRFPLATLLLTLLVLIFRCLASAAAVLAVALVVRFLSPAALVAEMVRCRTGVAPVVLTLRPLTVLAALVLRLRAAAVGVRVALLLLLPAVPPEDAVLNDRSVPSVFVLTALTGLVESVDALETGREEGVVPECEERVERVEREEADMDVLVTRDAVLLVLAREFGRFVPVLDETFELDPPLIFLIFAGAVDEPVVLILRILAPLPDLTRDAAVDTVDLELTELSDTLVRRVFLVGVVREIEGERRPRTGRLEDEVPVVVWLRIELAGVLSLSSPSSSSSSPSCPPRFPPPPPPPPLPSASCPSSAVVGLRPPIALSSVASA
jgi:hypothetical protein